MEDWAGKLAKKIIEKSLNRRDLTFENAVINESLNHFLVDEKEEIEIPKNSITIKYKITKTNNKYTLRNCSKKENIYQDLSTLGRHIKSLYNKREDGIYYLDITYWIDDESVLNYSFKAIN